MLQVEHLKAGYGDKDVIDLPSLRLEQGKHALLLGPSGAGKTTLLYALAGLLTPRAGSIRMGDHEITTMSNSARDAFRGRQIGIIYQTLHLVPALTVIENLLLVNYAAGVTQDRAYAQQLLEMLGLGAFADRLPETLSQGQQQRVAIARAAMNRPALILGDEPTSALDDASCEKVMALLAAVASACGASLVVATHDTRIRPHFSTIIQLGGAA